MHLLLKKLQGNDRRSIGNVPQVVSQVLRDTSLFPVLVNGMFFGEPTLRMRASDAVEKITGEYPELLKSHKSRLLQELPGITQQEVRWHMAQIVPRLGLTPAQRRKTLEALQMFLTDRSSIVKTFTMQALADLAEQDVRLRNSIIKQLEHLARTGTPAMRSRGKKLIAKLMGPSARAQSRRRIRSGAATHRAGI